MPAERDVVQLLLAYQDLWFAHFPPLSRRAEWHIVHHLCTKGRNGCPVGELYGLVKQIFLLDDATVKERLLTISQLGFCELDSGKQIYARTVVVPTATLLDRFDAHLRDFAGRLSALAPVLGMPVLNPPPAALLAEDRALLLRPLSVYEEAFAAALDRLFAATKLSPARRLDAKRNLLSPSHWNLVHNALRHDYESEATSIGILADRLAAQLLALTGQTLQTTRDHIVYLLDTGLFQRMRGKALHVTMSTTAMQQIGLALGETQARLPAILQALGDRWGVMRTGEEPDDLSTTMQRGARAEKPPPARYRLDVLEPAGVAPIALRPPQTIGRTALSDIVLKDSEVSRTHCRITEADGHLVVTDLNSTNGTLVNGTEITAATPLHHGDRLQVGCHVMLCQDRGAAVETPASRKTVAHQA
jgi:hypothetical protein